MEGWTTDYKGVILAKAGIEGRTVGALHLRMNANGDWESTVSFHPVRAWIPEDQQLVQLLKW
jgi:hypothetical protein